VRAPPEPFVFFSTPQSPNRIENGVAATARKSQHRRNIADALGFGMRPIRFFELTAAEFLDAMY
jgi:hypothetical protein